MLRVLATGGRLLRALAALVLLAGFLVGVPWLLVQCIGWPLDWIGWSHAATVPSLDDLATALTTPWSDDKILALLATVGWALWLLFCRDVLVEVLDASAAPSHRDRDRRPARGRSPIRWVAAVLVGAIAGAVLLDSMRGLAGAPPPSAAAADAAARRPAVTIAPAADMTAPTLTVTAQTSPALASAATSIPTLTVTTTSGAAGAVPAWASDAPGGVHHVVAGDNLWDIAKADLGDPHRWREIYVLNRGQHQANGYALSDPDEIHVGWVLALPARDPAAAAPSTQPVEPAESAEPAPGAADPGPPTTASPSTTSTASPAASPSAASTPSPAASLSPAVSNTPASAAPTVEATGTGEAAAPGDSRQTGVTLPSQGWISLGLAATIAAVAGLLRMHRRRHARLGSPIPVSTGPTRPPVPAGLALADAAGRRDLEPDPESELTDEQPLPTARPALPVLDAPVGVDAGGVEVSLFDLPGPGVALHGPGAEATARTILASALATGVSDTPALRPIVVTTPDTLARLLPDGTDPTGLDPHGITFDGERLLLLADTAAAVTHAEEEMISRRRLLDAIDAPSIADLNDRDDHIEHQPPYVLLIDSDPRHAGRVAAIGAHRTALHLHPVILGDADTLTALTIAADGTLPDRGRFATLTATDLAQFLDMIAETAARPEPGTDPDERPEPSDETRDAGHPDETSAEETAPALAVVVPDLPAPSGDAPALVRLTVLGAVTVTTDAGPITTGMRSGSYAALALLAAHPHGRTLRQIAADLHPDTNPDAAVKRVRTDISTARRVLRTATGSTEAKFIVYDPAATRYRLDPDTIEVDLWRMLGAIGRANIATDDTTALAALREAADLYAADFAEGQDRAWVTDYATTHRHQILGVYARIAELLETDQPDAAVAALETALRYDPVNEELYQRVMRIHGRQHRPDAVRRTLRQLEAQLAELGDAEPSEATRSLAERQLRPIVAGVRS
ncbi:BTAD domain-containing putative transcriptional regulator [Dactylosporangium sp. NPDC000244]|uniref:BTAD domain-containing putative transcriptional regulator n=1 Tax=Dactylosporangium sp. NPDC000244 TaxID=3154365 RepID=UPI00333155C2